MSTDPKDQNTDPKDQDPKDQNPDQNAGGGDKNDKSDPKNPKDNQVPQWRVNELVKERNSLRAKLEDIETKQEEARKKKLEKDGELQTLLDEEKAERVKFEDRAKKWDEYQTNRRETLMEKLSDEDKVIAESISDLNSLESFVERVTKNPAVPATDDGPGGKGGSGKYGGYDTKAEFAAKKPEEYLKWQSENQLKTMGAGTVRLPGQEPIIKR